MGKRSVTAGFLFCAAVAACNLGSSEDDASTSEAANTAARQPILAPTWAKCWVVKDTSTTDPERQQHAVTCRYDAPDEKQPVKLQWMLADVHYGGSNSVGRLEEHAGEDFVVAKVSGKSFPIEIHLMAFADFSKVGIGSLEGLRLDTKVESPDALTAENPIVVKQPFDVWPVVTIKKSFLFYVQLDERTVPVAPLLVGTEGTSSELSARGKILGTRSEPEVSIVYFAAPKEGELKGSYKTAKEGGSITEIAGGARIPAPGVYVATETEFRKATDEEASIAGPGTPAPTPDADASAPPAADGGSAEASVDAGPPRTCGVPGKTCCDSPNNNGYGGTCDEGSFCFSGENTCSACGGPGQKCCGGPNKNGYGGTCNDGSFCFSGENTCTPCGGPGQKCCAGPNKNGYGGTCDTGGFCFSGENVCTSCGKAGQKCCGGPNNNGYGGTCEAGATCKAGNNVCTANP